MWGVFAEAIVCNVGGLCSHFILGERILEVSGPQGRGPGGADGEVQEPNMLYKKKKVFYNPRD